MLFVKIGSHGVITSVCIQVLPTKLALVFCVDHLRLVIPVYSSLKLGG